MKRICFLVRDISVLGGTVRMTALLANRLCGEYAVDIISISQNGSVPEALDPRITLTVLKPVSGKTAFIRQIGMLRSFIKKKKADWLINVDVGMGIFGIPAVFGTKTKVITWEHGNFFNNWDSRVFPYFRRFSAKHSNAVVVLTQKDKQNYLSNLNMKTPVYVIPNPADKKEFTYDENAKIILSAGMMMSVKGFDKAVQIAAEVLPSHPDWKWVICGDGWNFTQIQKLVEDYGLQGRVILPGKVYDMEERYRRAAMYVMTSQSEGLPMVLLEAKALGLPLVSFDIMTGPSEIIRDGVNGYLVPLNDLQGMANRITELMNSTEKRKAFSEQSQLDMEKFDFENITAQWRKLLNG